MVHLNVWLTINHMIDDAIKGNKEIKKKKKKIIIIIIIIEKKTHKSQKKKGGDGLERERACKGDFYFYFFLFCASFLDL